MTDSKAPPAPSSNQQNASPGYPELCWLIEYKPGAVNLYFTGDSYQAAWTDDPNKALRFPSRHVAQIARNVYWQIQRFGSGHSFNMPDGDEVPPVRICDHLWMQEPREESAPETTGWQPMETAPKDGTRIHLGFAHMRGFDVVAHWDEGSWALTGNGRHAERLAGRPAPSGWRPLPAPPGSPVNETAPHVD